jgi:chromosome segregation ATPase
MTTTNEAGENFQEHEREHRTAEDAMRATLARLRDELAAATGTRFCEQCVHLTRERDELRAATRGEAAHIASLEGLLVESKEAVDDARRELRLIRQEYTDADSENLTRDALVLKASSLMYDRNELRSNLDRITAASGVMVRSLERMTAERDALRAVYAAANDWLTRLGEKGHRYHDGVPGDLMDAIDAVATLRSGKL